MIVDFFCELMTIGDKIKSSVFWHDKAVLASLVLIGGLNAISWILMLIKVRVGEEVVAWHYTIYFGVDRLGDWWAVMRYPLYGLVVIVFDLIVALLVYHRRRLYAYLVFSVAIAIQLMLAINVLSLFWFLL
jgi:hypothetical protein